MLLPADDQPHEYLMEQFTKQREEQRKSPRVENSVYVRPMFELVRDNTMLCDGEFSGYYLNCVCGKTPHMMYSLPPMTEEEIQIWLKHEYISVSPPDLVRHSEWYTRNGGNTLLQEDGTEYTPGDWDTDLG